MQEILFTKMQGIGNDYIYINCLETTPPNISELSIEMSRRGLSVGADGIILILPSEVADFKMRIFNADGSEAKMCGNGSRCVGKYVYDYNLTSKTVVTLETLGGIKVIKLNLGADGLVESARVDMGEPILEARQVPAISSDEQMIDAPVATSQGEVRLTAVSMGNPHGVIFLPTLEGLDIKAIGPELEHHRMWPERANIEFAHVVNDSEIEMRVWERGSGETLACGTGACATAVAAVLTGRAGRKVTLHLLGGDLEIEWSETDNHVYMTGPARTVYEGRYYREATTNSEL